MNLDMFIFAIRYPNCIIFSKLQGKNITMCQASISSVFEENGQYLQLRESE